MARVKAKPDTRKTPSVVAQGRQGALMRLQLTRFRSYEDAALEAAGEPVVLFGPNGAGKTNLLEAVSLLSPGRGLRHAKIAEIQKTDSAPSRPWAVAAEVSSETGPVKLGTGRDLIKDRRIVRIDGQNAASQADLAQHLSVIWLTPQMDRLFLEGAAGRRRFLDRLVFSFDAAHAGRLTRYENALRQRAWVLRDAKESGTTPDASWLNGLELVMAETGVSLAAARLDLISRLKKAVEKEKEADFPAVRLEAAGWAEDRLNKKPALALEEDFKIRLTSSRTLDTETGITNIGPHRSDLKVWHGDHDRPAEQCSTGEQKALLLGIILANARLMKAEKGRAPVLLLDEVAAHLDEKRRAALYSILLNLGGQFFLTGTDRLLFSTLENKVRLVEVKDAALRQA